MWFSAQRKPESIQVDVVGTDPSELERARPRQQGQRDHQPTGQGVMPGLCWRQEWLQLLGLEQPSLKDTYDFSNDIQTGHMPATHVHCLGETAMHSWLLQAFMHEQPHRRE